MRGQHDDENQAKSCREEKRHADQRYAKDLKQRVTADEHADTSEQADEPIKAANDGKKGYHNAPPTKSTE